MLKLQGNQNVRLDIFLNAGTPIGDIALQNLDRVNVTVIWDAASRN